MDQKLGFGKFKGQYINDVPSFYLKWLILNAYDYTVKKAAEDEWARRSTWGGHWGLPKKKLFS